MTQVKDIKVLGRRTLIEILYMYIALSTNIYGTDKLMNGHHRTPKQKTKQ